MKADRLYRLLKFIIVHLPLTSFAIFVWSTIPTIKAQAAENLPFSKYDSFTTLSDEDLSKFSQLFVLSDIHGQFQAFWTILVRSGLITPDHHTKWPVNGFKWSGKNSLLLILGDLINKGPDSVGAVLLVKRLMEEAHKSGGRVIPLLGNHEAKFLGDAADGPSEENISVLLATADQPVYRPHLDPQGDFGDQARPRELRDSVFGDILREFKLGAVFARRVWTHSGLLFNPNLEWGNTDRLLLDLEECYRKLLSLHHINRRQDMKILGTPLEPILMTHDWINVGLWRKKMRDFLARFNLSGIAMGHEPSALGAENEMAINQSQWILKIDVGLGKATEEQAKERARILHCDLKLTHANPTLPLNLDIVRSCRVIPLHGEPTQLRMIPGFD